MTTTAIRFRCPECRARIKASVQLGGRSCPCPRCGRTLTVPAAFLGEDRAVLVTLEGEERFVLRAPLRQPA
jgi:hypothetical protein